MEDNILSYYLKSTGKISESDLDESQFLFYCQLCAVVMKIERLENTNSLNVVTFFLITGAIILLFLGLT